jgi:predicted ATP-grasp superfamily ATP-dependent carboligase
MAEPLIILGASARAAAQSAQRAGYAPWCVDLFADRDLRQIAAAHQCDPSRYPASLLDWLDEAPLDAAALITGALENHPKVLAAIEFERPLLGSPSHAIEAVRNPRALSSLPGHSGLKLPVVTRGGVLTRAKQLTAGALTRRQYLVKPVGGSGGHGIRWGTSGETIGADAYLQQYVRGRSISAVYWADGWSAALVGATRQLVGEHVFGAGPFQYCGSIGPLQLSETQRQALSHLGVVLAQRHDLRGVFGVDLVMDWRDRLWPVEVNPRYPASVEVLELATGKPVLSSPRHQPRERKRRGRRQPVQGKAVLFAHRSMRVPDLYEHLGTGSLGDVPETGATIGRGRPICTIFAAEATEEACQQALQQRADRVYQSLELA